MNNEVIVSLDNPLVKEARSLNDKKFRKNLGKFLVDGEKLVNELVERNEKIDKIFVENAKFDNFSYIFDKFHGKIVIVSKKVMESISQNNTPQGIVAEVFMPENLEFLPEKNKPFLVLDRIQDPGNIGTILRTAVATGFSTVALIDSADVYSPKVIRSSSGGIFGLKLFKLSEQEVIDFCKNSGVELLVADMSGENIFDKKVSNKNFALVIGNEGQGVSDNFVLNGKTISLPMVSSMESLNAGVSASVLMYVLVGKDIK